MRTRKARPSPMLNRMLIWWLDILSVGGVCLGLLVFWFYLAVGDPIMLQATGVIATLTWGLHRWHLRLQSPRVSDRRKRRTARRNGLWFRRQCLGAVRTLATRYVCVRVMWAHLILSLMLPLWPGWVDWLLRLDALYEIPMMINLITIEYSLPFNLTACALTLLLVPSYGIYKVASFRRTDSRIDWFGEPTGLKARLKLVASHLTLLALFAFTMWEMWGVLLPAQDYSIPLHLTTSIGLILFSIAPLYLFAAMAPGLLLSMTAIWRPQDHTGHEPQPAAKASKLPRKTRKQRKHHRSSRRATLAP